MKQTFDPAREQRELSRLDREARRPKGAHYLLFIMIVLTAVRGVIAWIRKDPHARLIAAEGIAIALTFKMGGEVLRTVIVREWRELLILGAIVLLRVVMALIIHFEIRSERQILGDEPNERSNAKPTDAPTKRIP